MKTKFDQIQVNIVIIICSNYSWTPNVDPHETETRLEHKK